MYVYFIKFTLLFYNIAKKHIGTLLVRRNE
jgi:hypothetical protein